MSSRLGLTGTEFVPSEGTVDSPTHPTNLSLLIGLQLLEPHNIMPIQGLPCRKALAILLGPHPQTLPWQLLPSGLALQQPEAGSPDLSLTLTGGLTVDFWVSRFLWAQKFYLL